MELNICHLYPDILNLYGDRGNIITMKRRLEGRGIKVLPEVLVCHGKVGLFGGKNPDEEDFAAARKFAQSCMDKALHHEI